MQFLQETTKWSGDVKIPNHIYAFEGSSCVGYIKAGTTELLMFGKPSKQFSKSRRTFKKVEISA